MTTLTLTDLLADSRTRVVPGFALDPDECLACEWCPDEQADVSMRLTWYAPNAEDDGSTACCADCAGRAYRSVSDNAYSIQVER